MKILSILIISLILFASCENQPTQKEATANKVASIENQVKGVIYGIPIKDDNIISTIELPVLLKTDSEKELKLKGNVNAVCQGSGCWVDIEIGEGEIVHVTFKDEAFTLPKDIAGKTAVFSGVATTEVVSVKMLKQMAEEEGQSQEEINEITQPLTEYYFEADGLTLISEDL